MFDFCRSFVGLKIKAVAPSPASNARLQKLLRTSKTATISPRSATFILTKIQTHRHVKTARICCQTISNYCMRPETAEMFVNLGAIKRVSKVIEAFPDDVLTLWLGCSSLWNLARPPNTRDKIPTKTYALLQRVLSRHSLEKKVVQCALGALSNIAICERFQKPMCNKAFLELLIKVWDHFKSEESVETAACGLVANLAIDDDCEDKLISAGVIARLLPNARGNLKVTSDIRRNVAAALSNLSHGRTFADSVLEGRGVEQIYSLLGNPGDDDAVRALLHNSLDVMGLPIDRPTTSLHVAAQAGHAQVVRNIIKQAPEEMNTVDCSGYTPLDVAILCGKSSVVHFLGMVGAETSGQDLPASPDVEPLSPTADPGEKKLPIKFVLKLGRKEFRRLKAANVKQIYKNKMIDLPEAIAKAIVSFNSGVDRYIAVKDRV